MKVVVTKEELLRIERAIRREEALERGRLFPRGVVHVDKKKQANKNACRRGKGSPGEE